MSIFLKTHIFFRCIMLKKAWLKKRCKKRRRLRKKKKSRIWLVSFLHPVRNKLNLKVNLTFWMPAQLQCIMSTFHSRKSHYSKANNWTQQNICSTLLSVKMQSDTRLTRRGILAVSVRRTFPTSKHCQNITSKYTNYPQTKHAAFQKKKGI